MPTRVVVVVSALAVLALAAGPGAVASEPAHSAAKGKDCRSQRGVLLKFTKLRAFSVGCKRARRIARGVYNSERCSPGIATGASRTCTVRGYTCRTRSYENSGSFSGRCVRAGRKIVYAYHA